MKALPVLHTTPAVVNDEAAPPWPHQPTVEWQVVGRCNYDCSYCIQSKKHRVGISADDDLRRGISFLATLPGPAPWEIKTTGGEPFSFKGFLDVVVPGLMHDTPHVMSTLTNLSPPPATLQKFAALTRGRLKVVSASLHLEHTTPDTFLLRLQALRDAVDSDVHLVVNAVLVPDRLEQVKQAQAAIVGAGFRFFPQVMKVKGGVFAYSQQQWQQVQQIVGDLDVAAATRSANLAPAYTGKRCWAGARYFVLTKEGDAFSCRTARRHGDGFLGNIFVDSDVSSDLRKYETRPETPRGVVLQAGARVCPYTICPCATPANRGMIEGVTARRQLVEEDV